MAATPPERGLIYKIVPAPLWREAIAAGRFNGAGVDLADGYIHFSTATQVQDTAARHFAGQVDLVLVAVDPDQLSGPLRWEPSRGGALFPHLYQALPLSAVSWTVPLPLGPDGRHRFPILAEHGVGGNSALLPRGQSRLCCRPGAGARRRGPVPPAPLTSRDMEPMRFMLGFAP